MTVLCRFIGLREILKLATGNPPPLRNLPQELTTFLRQLWDRVFGPNNGIDSAQLQAFNGLNSAQVQALAQELDYTRCQLSLANANVSALRQEVDYLQSQSMIKSSQTAALNERLNDIEVLAWL